VFDIARTDAGLVASTNGGLIELKDGRWRETPSPSGLRRIVSVSPLSVVMADGREVRSSTSGWSFVDASSTGPVVSGDPLPGTSATVYRSLDGWAATNHGLFQASGSSWSAAAVPDRSPVARPNGLAEVGSQFVVGGLGGAFLGAPGHWRQVSSSPVRQVLGVDNEAWVVYGNGAVDKVDPAGDRVFPDLLYGAVKRPWCSCEALIGSRLCFGTHEGWIERGATLEEHYLPQLAGDEVMSLAGRDRVRWIGTQKTGLIRWDGSKVKVWNPGNGLDDTWVTSLCLAPPSGLYVGTATRGLYLLSGDTIHPVDCPEARVTKLCLWNGRLVVGGMHGAWVVSHSGWRLLPTEGEETTSLDPTASHLVVTTNAGVFFLKD